MEKYKNILISAISMIFGAFLQYVYSLAEDKQMILYVITLIVLVWCVAILIVLQYIKQKKKLRYSVLIFVLDKDNRLLTQYNSYHKRIMIPCGVVPSHLTPNEAVENFLVDQTGLSMRDVNILNRLDNDKQLITYNAQIEFITNHEKRVKEHYAFIYYARLKKNAEEVCEANSSIEFFNLEQLKEMPQDTGLFSDILKRYQLMIENDMR